jgi:hypothetical protein
MKKQNSNNKRKPITKDWYNSKNVRPKIFNIALERDARGGYRVLSGTLLNMVNQWEVLDQRVDARDLVSDIREKGIFVR